MGFLQRLNSINECTKFIIHNGDGKEGSLPFPENLLRRKQDGTIEHIQKPTY